MTEIKVLDKSVFNRIAAGEVVERPASVVKELIENSIDAGADSITVTIKGGGVDYICVSDNGKGIPAHQIKTAFMPHATSKISSVNDLDSISTLGFRGEALPSIASVAKVTMLSRPCDCDVGCRYIVDNGIEVDYGDMGAPVGTSVTVENLFEHIPARKKFLSRESVEESTITGLMSRYILANSNITFKYIVNDKIIYISSGDGIENAILAVYGSEYLSNMIHVNSNMSGIALCGYINKPAFTKHSKAFQTLVINGRYVVNDDISYTVYGCYQKYLMKRQFPTYVLYLDMPYDLIDVNVHPNKLEVKFALPGLIKKLVADTIKEQVLSAVSVPKEIDSIVDNSIISSKHEHHEPFVFSLNPNRESSCTDIIDCDNTVPRENNFDCISNQTPKSDSLVIDNDVKQPQSVVDILKDLTLPRMYSLEEDHKVDKLCDSSVDDVFSAFIDNNNSSIVADTMKEIEASRPIQYQFNVSDVNNYKIDGKIFNTYIIIEQLDSVYLIDQHAAHEKILYDRFVSEYERGNVAMQNMLVPYKFTVSPEESDFIKNNIQLLTSTGFEVTVGERSDTFFIKAVPLCCAGLNVQSFVSDFLQELSYNKSKMLPSAFKEILMQTACKSATKGEDDLSDIEIKELLTQMAKETTELFCPHGRPIAIKLTRHEVEKWFKRIV